MKDNQLVFIISQPRSGSSMLQQLIGFHPDVMTAPETWMMLPLVYFYKKDNYARSIYNYAIGHQGLQEYLSTTDSLELAKDNLRSTALNMYGHTLGESKYFLDKTTRYYHILNELIDLFPNAKFILLVRNPLSVFGSFLNIFCKFNLRALPGKDLYSDLFLAPKIIQEVKNRQLENVHFTRYEELIKNSNKEVAEIYKFIGLNPIENAGEYKVKDQFTSSAFIDPKSVKKHSKPVALYSHEWKKHISTTLKKKWLKNYIDFLGEPLLNDFGYDYNELVLSVNDHKVKRSFISVSKSNIISTYDSLSRFNRTKLKAVLTLNDGLDKLFFSLFNRK